MWIDLGLKKGNAIVSWLIRLAAFFCQSLLITGLSYCPMIKVDWLTAGVLLGELAHRLQILPGNEILGLEAGKISQTLLTNRMQRKLQDTNNGGAPEIICQDSLAGCWCTADLCWLNRNRHTVPCIPNRYGKRGACAGLSYSVTPSPGDLFLTGGHDESR